MTDGVKNHRSINSWENEAWLTRLDVVFAGFYFSALLFYMRCRSLYGRLNLLRTCIFLGLYVCALNSKEMAVSLPVIVFAYELLYHVPKSWKTAGTPGRLLADAAPALAAIAITIYFIGVKMLGPGSLAKAEGFQPAYTWTGFFETNIHYLNTIFYTTRFTPELVKEGRLLYMGLSCNQCHGDNGKGDGPSKDLKDETGEKMKAHKRCYTSRRAPNQPVQRTVGDVAPCCL